MPQFDDTNRFVLFINDNSANPKAPSHKGKININGVEYNLAGWKKFSANGVEFISGSIEKPDAFAPHSVTVKHEAPKPKPMNDDEIPF